ncbi:MAG: hypothetical protein WBP85_16690 [Terracidiphilus sp.]
MSTSRTFFVLFIAALSLFAIPMRAQSQAATQAAPVPAQLLNARKVFIADTVGWFDTDIWSGTQDRLYNETYAAIEGWGHLQVVGSPADADVVLHPSISNPACAGEVCGAYPMMRFELIDPKTGIVLWGRISSIGLLSTKKTNDREFEAAITALIGDLKQDMAPGK